MNRILAQLHFSRLLIFSTALRQNPVNTYLLVHGAWHPEACWDLVKEKLEQKGHKVFTVQLPGLGNDNTPLETITLATHVNAVKQVLKKIPGKVILVGHSYGGVVISQTGQEMSEKIEKLVYLTAFMLQNGQSLADIALQDAQSVVTQNLVVAPPAVSVPSDKYVSAFYNQIEENNNGKTEEEVNRIISMLKPHPFATMVTPVNLGPEYASLEKVYISCLKDHAITPSAQKSMYTLYPETTIHTMDADHSPFITRVNQLSNLLSEM
jgi:alpha-beta hydrolase superfamily lysophospholipase